MKERQNPHSNTHDSYRTPRHAETRLDKPAKEVPAPYARARTPSRREYAQFLAWLILPVVVMALIVFLILSQQ